MGAPAKKVPAKKAVSEKSEEKKAKKGYIIAEPGIYVAERDCTFGISMFKAGGKAHGGKDLRCSGGEIIPHHFVKKKEYEKMLQEAEAAAEAEAEDY